MANYNLSISAFATLCEAGDISEKDAKQLLTEYSQEDKDKLLMELLFSGNNESDNDMTEGAFDEDEV